MNPIYSHIRKALICIGLIFTVGMGYAQTLDRSIRPSAAPAKAIEIKDAKTFTLANGLKVFVVEDHRAPIVYYAINLDIKPALEGDKAGLETLTSRVMGTATQSRSREQIRKEADLIGAQISSGSRRVNGTVLKKYEDHMLELLADILLNPVFSQEILDLERDKSKSELTMVNDNITGVNDRLSQALTYGKDFPSGELETTTSLDKVVLQDLENFHKAYTAPNVARLVIVGDITEAEAKAQAQKYFGNWAKKDVPVAQYALPQAPATTQVAMVSRPGSVQSAIDISYPISFKPGAPDTEAATIMTYILGGGSSSRLFQNLRETHSYTYGVYNILSPGELMGRYHLTAGRGDAASVKGAATDSALVEVLYEINKIRQHPISEQELKDAKAFFAGDFGRSLESASTIASYAIMIDKYGLPKDYYKNYLKRLEAVTVADVQAAAKKYLQPEKAWIVVVGDPSLEEGLKALASDKQVQFFDGDANPVAAPVVQKVDLSPTDILNNYVTALGGQQAIDNIKDCKTTAQMSSMGQMLDMTTLFMVPNYSALSVSMGGMIAQQVVFNGHSVKISAMGNTQEFTEGEVFETYKNGVELCPGLKLFNSPAALSVAGIESIEGIDAYALRADMGSSQAAYYFDTKTGLLLRFTETSETPQGSIQQITDYSDYRPVGGVLFAHKMVQKVPAMNMEIPIEVKSVEVNIGLTEANF
jgi:Predicted Zn-dependent peptidases